MDVFLDWRRKLISGKMVYICICTMVSKIPQQKRWEVIYFPTVFPWSTPLPPMRLLLNALWKSSTVKSSMVLVRTQNIVVFIGPQKKKSRILGPYNDPPASLYFMPKNLPSGEIVLKNFRLICLRQRFSTCGLNYPFTGVICAKHRYLHYDPQQEQNIVMKQQ